MTVDEARKRVDALNEPIDALVKEGLETLPKEDIEKAHAAFVRGQEELYADLRLLGRKVLLNPLVKVPVLNSLEEFGVKYVDGCKPRHDEPNVTHWYLRTGEDMTTQLHAYEMLKTKREGDESGDGDFYDLLVFADRWLSQNGTIAGMNEALDDLDIRFCVIDSELARRIYAGDNPDVLHNGDASNG